MHSISSRLALLSVILRLDFMQIKLEVKYGNTNKCREYRTLYRFSGMPRG